jgi:hypothetical protein
MGSWDGEESNTPRGEARPVNDDNHKLNALGKRLQLALSST